MNQEMTTDTETDRFHPDVHPLPHPVGGSLGDDVSGAEGKREEERAKADKKKI